VSPYHAVAPFPILGADQPAGMTGGVAGAIPVLRTGNPRVIVATALGSAAFMGLLEGVESVFSGRKE
jgi:hypothetical protein